ncbi:glutaredoxin family protein [Cellulomonas fengjieae]|uniref:Glutaredoxin family protein n=1 Tax=Cellulomonas fengjieae TaxID=2819978 RepID=A0ABS3SCL4_9CELL|nr:glutaredoxin family protein [Cellulomonas fengjieae]MBO3083467.1 glutaredoxin family protein [Cellulomonas fengjieae]MBO3101782.1 glutaredoxin family protein [Cellulomonas fengjieae]QVI65205.1 glutaredoxin family protein [Cellulomonas fengjieae]
MTRVVLFGRDGCHLCDEAREVVRAVCDETGVPWSEVDIDSDQVPGRDLVAELGELVPVVEVDGVQQGYWRIDAARLRRTLTAAGPRPLA